MTVTMDDVRGKVDEMTGKRSMKELLIGTYDMKYLCKVGKLEVPSFSL